MSLDKILIDPSSDFLSLCQSQISLLSETLEASWSIVYLRDHILSQGEQTKLIPVATYPLHLFTLQQFHDKLDIQPPLLPPENQVVSYNKQHQLVVPLIYENVVFGILVTQRDKKNWTEKELLQIKNIALTIAIARALDQRQNWYAQTLTEQEKIELLKRNKLDDFLHQLRNPITALRTFSKLLLKRLLPDDPNQQVAQSMLRESDRLSEMALNYQIELSELENSLSNCLNTSQSTPPKALPPSSVVLSIVYPLEVLKPLLASAGAIALDKGIILKADIPPRVPQVLACASVLYEILNNLIDNGLKYTPKGGKVEIQFLEKTEDKNDYLGIAISDHGLGISPEDQKHLFERHYRGEKANSKIAGTGLGLAIAKEMAEQMQGKIEVLSPNPNREVNGLPGSLFVVWLKIVK